MESKKKIFKTAQNFNKLSKPHKNFHIINWNQKIVSLSISSQGSQGVIFIETKGGSIVFKPTDQVSIDVFLNQFAKVCQINVPLIRVISWDAIQFKYMMKAIQKHCYQDQPLYRRILARLNRPYYQILEYIPSVTLQLIGPRRFQKIFDNPKNLVELGRIISYDMILNNSDRFYLFWDTQGNAGNLLFTVNVKNSDSNILNQRNQIQGIEFLHLMAIDTRPTIMDIKDKYSNQNFDVLKNRIKDFLMRIFQFHQLIENQDQQIPVIIQFSNLNHQFQLYTQSKFNNEQIKVIYYGIILTLEKFLKLKWTGLQQLINKIKKQGEEEWTLSYWNNSLAKLHESYFKQLYKFLEIVWTVNIISIESILKSQDGIQNQQIKSNQFQDLQKFQNIQFQLNHSKNEKSNKQFKASEEIQNISEINKKTISFQKSGLDLDQQIQKSPMSNNILQQNFNKQKFIDRKIKESIQLAVEREKFRESLKQKKPKLGVNRQKLMEKINEFKSRNV